MNQITGLTATVDRMNNYLGNPTQGSPNLLNSVQGMIDVVGQKYITLEKKYNEDRIGIRQEIAGLDNRLIAGGVVVKDELTTMKKKLEIDQNNIRAQLEILQNKQNQLNSMGVTDEDKKKIVANEIKLNELKDFVNLKDIQISDINEKIKGIDENKQSISKVESSLNGFMGDTLKRIEIIEGDIKGLKKYKEQLEKERKDYYDRDDQRGKKYDEAKQEMIKVQELINAKYTDLSEAQKQLKTLAEEKKALNLSYTNNIQTIDESMRKMKEYMDKMTSVTPTILNKNPQPFQFTQSARKTDLDEEKISNLVEGAWRKKKNYFDSIISSNNKVLEEKMISNMNNTLANYNRMVNTDRSNRDSRSSRQSSSQPTNRYSSSSVVSNFNRTVNNEANPRQSMYNIPKTKKNINPKKVSNTPRVTTKEMSKIAKNLHGVFEPKLKGKKMSETRKKNIETNKKKLDILPKGSDMKDDDDDDDGAPKPGKDGERVAINIQEDIGLEDFGIQGIMSKWDRKKEEQQISSTDIDLLLNRINNLENVVSGYGYKSVGQKRKKLSTTIGRKGTEIFNPLTEEEEDTSMFTSVII